MHISWKCVWVCVCVCVWLGAHATDLNNWESNVVTFFGKLIWSCSSLSNILLCIRLLFLWGNFGGFGANEQFPIWGWRHFLEFCFSSTKYSDNQHWFRFKVKITRIHADFCRNTQTNKRTAGTKERPIYLSPEYFCWEFCVVSLLLSSWHTYIIIKIDFYIRIFIAIVHVYDIQWIRVHKSSAVK